MSPLKRVIDTILATVCVVLFALLVIVVSWQVFSRQVLASPGTWTSVAAQYLFVWLALFGSGSWAAVAFAAAVGTVMGPRQRAQGYDRGFSAAVNAASAPAGMLLPPSNTLIVYSLVSSTSIAALFMAGYGPGLLWALTCMVVVFLYSRKHRIGGGEGMPLKVVGVTLFRALLPLLMIVIVIGGILTGIFKPTASAVIAVLCSLVLGMAYRMISLRQLPGILLSATRTTSIVMMLVGVATIMSWVMSYSRIPQLIAETMLGIAESPTLILLFILVLLVAVGTFLDPTPAILIFTPFFLPVVSEFGVDPIHFGLIVVFAPSLGTITPPVGNVLFVSAKVAGLRIEPVIAVLVRLQRCPAGRDAARTADPSRGRGW